MDEKKEVKIKRWLWFLIGFSLAIFLIAILFVKAYFIAYERSLNMVCIQGEWFKELIHDFNWSKYG